MKKLILFLCSLMLLAFCSAAMAKDNPNIPWQQRLAQIYSTQGSYGNPATMPKVSLFYLNNTKTTYNNYIDELMLQNFAATVNAGTYQYVASDAYRQKLSALGTDDITIAERADVIEAFAGSDIDYAIIMQIEPFVRKETMTVFTVGKHMTASVPFKIIDLKNNKYLYNGKITEIAKDSSVIGDVGNKSVALKALEKCNTKITWILDERLPKSK